MSIVTGAVITNIGGGGGGLSTVSTSAPATGDGSVAHPVTVQASSGSQAGSMASADFSKLAAIYRPKAGSALTDADQTLQPFTDKSDQYVQSVALTSNRTKTLGVTSVVTGTVVRLVRSDTAAFTMAVVNGGTNGGTLFTFASTPTEIQATTFYYNGVDWVLNGFEYLTVT
jgi:hypothetical protein